MAYHKSNLNWSRSGTSTSKDIVTDLVTSLAKTERLSGIASIPPWTEVVGSALAKVSYPYRVVKNKILVIRVLDCAFTTELSLMKVDILRTIKRISPTCLVTDLRFETGSPKDKEFRRQAF